MICIVAVDSLSASELVRSILEDLGLEVWHTEDADSVIALAYAHPPHLLVVNVGLARIDGLAIVALLRDRQLLGVAKVIALAAGHHEIENSYLHANGVDRVLVKPFRAEALRNLIGELLP